MVEFLTEDIDFNFPLNKLSTIDLLLTIAKLEGKEIAHLNYIFTSNAYLLNINKQFLNHNYLTDVITFDNSDFFGVKGEIFISVEYIKENYLRYSLSYKREFLRCIIHGLLHIIGYDDLTQQARLIMRNKENYYLGLI